MKKILLVATVLLSAAATKAQRYTTHSVSEYQQLYSNRYTLVSTTPRLDVTWEVTPKQIYRVTPGGQDNWEVTKVQTVGKIKRYNIDAWGMDTMWLTIEGAYVVLYEKNGQTKRTFRIIRKEPLNVLQ